MILPGCKMERTDNTERPAANEIAFLKLVASPFNSITRWNLFLIMQQADSALHLPPFKVFSSPFKVSLGYSTIHPWEWSYYITVKSMWTCCIKAIPNHSSAVITWYCTPTRILLLNWQTDWSRRCHFIGHSTENAQSPLCTRKNHRFRGQKLGLSHMARQHHNLQIVRMRQCLNVTRARVNQQVTNKKGVVISVTNVTDISSIIKGALCRLCNWDSILEDHQKIFMEVFPPSHFLSFLFFLSFPW